MLTYRTFRNSDPPALAALWRSRAGQPGLLQPVSPDLLEQMLFAKLYFEYGGLATAWDEGELAGFAHAGFGPNDERSWISTETGVICMVMVRSGDAAGEVAAQLVDRCEAYLLGRGAKVLYGGGVQPFNPFYVGLYGGSELPGVLDSDTAARQAFAAHGYQEVERTLTLRRELTGFESIVDRQQMQIRRQMVVEVASDAPTRDWWEACTIGEFDLTRFELVPRNGGNAIASATFRSMEPTGTASVGRAAGLINVSVDPSYYRRGLAMFLLAEAFRQFLRQGIMHVEVQVPQANTAAMGVFQKLGFQQIDQGGVWKKTNVE